MLTSFGSAVIDILIHVDSDVVHELGYPYGGSQKVSREEVKILLERFPNHTVMPGGSSSNIIAMAGRHMSDVSFHAFCGNDDYSYLFTETLGVDINKHWIGDNTSVLCLCFVTPDKERTMVHAPVQKEIDPIVDIAADYVLIDGYNRPKHRFHGKIISCFSDIGCIPSVKEYGFIERSEIVVGNRKEFSAYWGIDGEHPSDILTDIVEKAHSGIRLFAMTNGADGAYVYSCDEDALYYLSTVSCPVVDTTGAGDAWTGGFLAGFLTGKSIEDSMLLARSCAMKVVGKIGARL